MKKIRMASSRINRDWVTWALSSFCECHRFDIRKCQRDSPKRIMIAEKAATIVEYPLSCMMK